MVILNNKIDTKTKAQRKEKGLTQEEVAKKAQVSTRYYQKIEAGESTPTATLAISIAQALGSTVEYLFSIPKAATNGIEKQPDGNRA